MSKTHLQALLADAGKAGVYHLPQMDKDVIMAEAEANGFAIFRVDLGGAGDKDGLLSAIGKALNFPDWFGHNLDGLADCLADMEWAAADGYLVLLEHCDGIHGQAEADFAAAIEIFEQAADEWREEGIPFWCLVEMQADGISWLPTEP